MNINRVELYLNGNHDFGSFETALIKAIISADLSNLKRLGKGFPDLVSQYLITMEWAAADIQELIK